MTEYLLRVVMAFFFIGLLIGVAYVEIFKIPSKKRKRAEMLSARATAQREGVEKICDAGRKLRELVERKTPLQEDPEMKEILWMLAEGEKQFRENSDPPAEEEREGR